MGYTPQVRRVRVEKDCFVRTYLKPLLFEIEEVTVESGRKENELNELTPSIYFRLVEMICFHKFGFCRG